MLDIVRDNKYIKKIIKSKRGVEAHGLRQAVVKIKRKFFRKPNVDELELFLRDFPLGVVYELKRNAGKNSDIFVQVHLFYEDLADEIINYLNNIPVSFDCYISTDQQEKANYIFEKFKENSKANYIQVGLYPNIGRDVAPFLLQMQNSYEKYKFFAHIHSKKSLYDNFGNRWREYLFKTLFGSEERVKSILEDLINNEKTGIIYPLPFEDIIDNMEWGGNYLLLKDLMKKNKCSFRCF